MGPGRGAGRWGPSPKKATKRLALASFRVAFWWLLLCCFFFFPRLAAGRQGEQTSCAASGRGCWGGGFWVPGFACPSPGQVAVAGSGQCASREGGRPGEIANRNPGSAGCCLSRQGFQLQLPSQGIFLKKSRCICLRRRVLDKGPAPLSSSLPPTFCLSRFSNPAASEVSRTAGNSRSMRENTARRDSLERGVPPDPMSCVASVCAA